MNNHAFESSKPLLKLKIESGNYEK